MHGLHKTSTSKGEQKSAIKFHKFPVYQKTEQQGTRSKGSRNETVYIYNRAREFLFASSANNETGKTCFVRRRWKYEDPRSASSNNRTRHVRPSPSHGCHSSPPTKGKTGGCKDTRGITRSRANQVPQRWNIHRAVIEGQHFTYGTL